MTKWSELKLHDGTKECPAGAEGKIKVLVRGMESMVNVFSGKRCGAWENVEAYRVEVEPVVFALNVNSSATSGEDGNIEVGHCKITGWDNLNLIKTGDEYAVEVVKPTEGE